jgi:SPP1 family phage portal protein
MFTYQDLMQIDPNDEKKRMAFVRSVISDHKSSDNYKIAVMGDEYDHKRNSTITHYEKTLRTLSGREVPDKWSPNHKTTRNFFNYFTTQQNQYLLGNGVSWQEDSTAEKLGDDFDTQLQKAGKKALVQGESFGFFNLDHLEVFELKEFAPLYDEENGSLRAGVRFWQITENKPLRAMLYEEDGYTSYIWNERDSEGKIIEGGRIYESKKKYILKVKTSKADGKVIYDGENYPSFPIVPLWGNPLHQSELVGIQEQIDAYDLIKNGFLNDLDTAQLYWIIRGAGGMDDPDLAQFMMRLKQTHFASLDNDQVAEPVTVDIPYNARETLLSRLERDIYKDYCALNVEEIKGGAVTATQILAAYEPLNTKADQYEYCVIDFLQGVLKVAGIENEQPTFTRSKLINVSEDVQTVLQANEVLDDEYVTEKILNLLGDGDKFEEIQKRKAADELQMVGRIDTSEEETNNPPESETR